MNIADQIRRQFTYDAWANQQVLRAIRAGGEGFERPLQLVSHKLSAERLWMERLKQAPQSLPVWPKFDLARCESEILDLKPAMERVSRTDHRGRSRSDNLVRE